MPWGSIAIVYYTAAYIATDGGALPVGKHEWVVPNATVTLSVSLIETWAELARENDRLHTVRADANKNLGRDAFQNFMQTPTQQTRKTEQLAKARRMTKEKRKEEKRAAARAERMAGLAFLEAARARQAKLETGDEVLAALAVVREAEESVAAEESSAAERMREEAAVERAREEAAAAAAAAAAVAAAELRVENRQLLRRRIEEFERSDRIEAERQAMIRGLVQDQYRDGAAAAVDYARATALQE